MNVNYNRLFFGVPLFYVRLVSVVIYKARSADAEIDKCTCTALFIAFENLIFLDLVVVAESDTQISYTGVKFTL